MQRMMKGLTVCFAILMIAGPCYVGSYIYFRETRAIKEFGPLRSYGAHFGEKDERLGTVHAPLFWLDRKLTGTTVHFVKPGTSVYF